MSYLPYDQRGNQLLCAWSVAIDQVIAATDAVRALPVGADARQVASELAAARATRDAAKVAHDRYRYQQRYPTHPVCASVLRANDAAFQHKPGLQVVVAIHEVSHALAA